MRIYCILRNIKTALNYVQWGTRRRYASLQDPVKQSWTWTRNLTAEQVRWSAGDQSVNVVMTHAGQIESNTGVYAFVN